MPERADLRREELGSVHDLLSLFVPRLTERPLRNVIADELRSRVISGEYEAGERIREEVIAAEFEVSRIPVREALQILEQQRFLILRPRRGAIVASPTATRAAELMGIRAELEAMAGRLAAEQRGGETLEELEACVREGTEAVAAGELERVPELAERFHDLLAVSSGNSELIEMLRSVRSRVNWMFVVEVEARAPGSWADHRAIVDSIAAGDCAEVDLLLRRHVLEDQAAFERLVPSENLDPTSSTLG